MFECMTPDFNSKQNDAADIHLTKAALNSAVATYILGCSLSVYVRVRTHKVVLAQIKAGQDCVFSFEIQIILYL